ncbi:major histocompatibility complex class I-related protein 1-like [Lissotriton helveticus]
MKLLHCFPLLSCLGLLRVGALGLHSLRYFFSFVSKPLPGVPQFSVVGYVDHVPIIGYTSESGKAGVRAPWMEKITVENPQFWEDSTKTFQEIEKVLNNKLKTLTKQKNRSPGLHLFQAIEGCELREDGSVGWIEQYAYDGSNYTENKDPATDTRDRGHSEEMDCSEHLKKLLKYGEESLQRRVTPRTRVSQRKTVDRTFLTGYAYEFYPRDIEVKWVRNGVEMPWESRQILPNPDGTYQIRITVEVQEGDDVRTEYHVNHISLTETVIVTYGEQRGGLESNELVALVVVLSLAVAMMTAMLVLAWAGILKWKVILSLLTIMRCPQHSRRNREGQDTFREVTQTYL